MLVRGPWMRSRDFLHLAAEHRGARCKAATWSACRTRVRRNCRHAITSGAVPHKNPDAGRRSCALHAGVKDVIADPKAAITTLKARDGLVNEELELRRLKLALDATVLTPDARAEGFGEIRAPRLSLMASQVSDAFGTKERVTTAAVWRDGFLPSAAESDIFKTPE